MSTGLRGVIPTRAASLIHTATGNTVISPNRVHHLHSHSCQLMGCGPTTAAVTDASMHPWPSYCCRSTAGVTAASAAAKATTPTTQLPAVAAVLILPPPATTPATDRALELQPLLQLPPVTSPADIGAASGLWQLLLQLLVSVRQHTVQHAPLSSLCLSPGPLATSSDTVRYHPPFFCMLCTASDCAGADAAVVAVAACAMLIQHACIARHMIMLPCMDGDLTRLLREIPACCCTRRKSSSCHMRGS